MPTAARRRRACAFRWRWYGPCRAALPAGKVLGARINGTDWADGGLTPDDAVFQAAKLKAAGLDYVCVSGGGAVLQMKVPLAPGYQVPIAARVRAEAGIVTRAVGLIVEPAQAEAIVGSGQADFVALARAILDNPRWVWHAAERLGGQDRLSAAIRPSCRCGVARSGDGAARLRRRVRRRRRTATQQNRRTSPQTRRTP